MLQPMAVRVVSLVFVLLASLMSVACCSYAAIVDDWETGVVRTPYDAVLDRVLPLDILPSAQDKVGGQAIVVRVAPGSEVREVHVELREKGDGLVECTVTKPVSISVFAQVDTMIAERSDLQFDELVQAIHTRRAVVTSAEIPQLRSLLDRLHRLQIAMELDQDIYLDATRYDMVVVSPMNRLQIRMFGSSRASDQQRIFTGWIDELLDAVKDPSGE